MTEGGKLEKQRGGDEFSLNICSDRATFGNVDSNTQNVRRVEWIDDIRVVKVTDEGLSLENTNLGESINKKDSLLYSLSVPICYLNFMKRAAMREGSKNLMYIYKSNSGTTQY